VATAQRTVFYGWRFAYLLTLNNTANTPLFHLKPRRRPCFGAFLIATDPVVSCTSNRGQLIYGAGVGILIVHIRFRVVILTAWPFWCFYWMNFRAPADRLITLNQNLRS